MVHSYGFALTFTAILLVAPLDARDRHRAAAPPQDQIEVTAHLPLDGDAVTRFLVTEHYGRNYLYAESNGGKTVRLIDVTDTAKPSMLADAATLPTSGTVVTAAGTAALMRIAGAAATIRIMSFADPAHPVVSREFPNVSAMGHDDKRGLIFLANAEGLWILRERLAVDPEFEKEWEHMMLDNR